MEHTVQLEAKSRELSRTARQLRAANEKLTDLSIQKDGFLSQISHELRTPMTSIRSFSEILRESDDLSSRQSKKYASIILEESIRLTRLLDEILDLSVLENGQVAMQSQQGMLSELIERAVSSAVSDKGARPLEVLRDLESEAISLTTDLDRLSQVFINLVSNARKYCDAATPQLRIVVTRQSGGITVDFIDNGAGIAEKHREIVFEKFSRLSDSSAAGSAGLGLAISREILRNLGGVIEYLPGQSGAGFRVTLPV
jgi:signal transduction histidine kinase